MVTQTLLYVKLIYILSIYKVVEQNERMNMRNMKGIIFDFDGTLLDLPIDYDLAREALLEYIQGCYNIHPTERGVFKLIEESVQKLRGRGIGECEIKEMIAKAYGILDEFEVEALNRTSISEETVVFLKGLVNKGVALAILTRNGRACIENAVKKLELPEHIAIVSRDDVVIEKVKPHPQHTKVALLSLDLDKGECAVVGDSWRDVASAISAGVFAILLSDAEKREVELKKLQEMKMAPDMTIKNLIELRDWLVMTGVLDEKDRAEMIKWSREMSGFEVIMCQYLIKELQELCKGSSVLDLGCGDGTITEALAKKFPRVVGVDASEELIGKAKERKTKAKFMTSLIEDLSLDEKFDSIVMIGVLEHLKNPVTTLVNTGRMLKPGGYVIAIVPNAKSLNRRIGMEMGIIKDPYELGTADVQIGHRRFYDIEMLTKDFIRAGYVIVSKGGIFLKPLSNAQMMSWDKSICDALYVIGKELPQYCGLIYVRGTMKQMHPKKKKK